MSMKLIIGNKAYSSWSLRGWLAMKQSGLPFEEVVVPMYDDKWDARKRAPDMVPANGKIPILWDGDVVVWDSLAIIEYMADKTSRDRFWPRDDIARGMARAMAAEMHSSYAALRDECGMNVRRTFTDYKISDAARSDAMRILQLWAEARSRFGSTGPYLFGTFSAADIMFAPVVTRFQTYGFTLPGFAQGYCEAIREHEWMRQWSEAAKAESWVIAKYENEG
jgi:glutathione S-transferase